jgi:imidazoleglycerol phosphate dehydratase HisB/histidinol-phosphate/aromatic aminotransferase/cobyric acid decarboxylase-like protein
MAYSPPEFKNEITLPLSRNESVCAIDDLHAQLGGLSTEFVSRYPAHAELQTLIGQWIGVDPERIVVTAGGDDSIDRVMRKSITGNRKKIVSHVPSFEMIDIYASNYSGQLDTVEWLQGDFPTGELIEKIDHTTAMVTIVSPNNPTGGLIPIDQILAIAAAAKSAGCNLLVDNAYIEFADTDPTAELITIDNVMIVRTFSKAWGLAGLRVGYLIAPNVEYATFIRNSAGPFPVSAVSLETARRCLADYQPSMTANVTMIKSIRKILIDLLEQCAVNTIPSSGNFVLAEFSDSDRVWDGLAEDGIGVRKFPGTALLQNRLRITCPTTPADYLQLAQSLCRIHDLEFEDQKVAVGQLIQENRSGEQSSSYGHSPGEWSKVSTPPDSPRTAALKRETRETKIDLALNLDGSGVAEIETGIGFLDHMLTALTFHSRMDLKLSCDGDLVVDDHHTAEDCALALGTAIDQALGRRSGIKRFGFAYAPLDEALARTVIDLSGRPWPEIHLNLEREMVGQWACENIVHFFHSLAMTLKCSLHVDVLRGTNDHHRAEAAFKSLAMALRTALTRTDGEVPSTKGVL